MFGIGFYEFALILVIAIIALGPDKMPKAIVEFAKILKTVKKTINEAKSAFDSELKIDELRDEAKKMQNGILDTTKSVRQKLTFDDLEELKTEVKSATDTAKSQFDEIKSSEKKDKNV